MNIILASASPRRAEILTQLGLKFKALAADIDEQVAPNEAAKDYVVRVAQEKLAAVSGAHENALVIAADTVVVLDEQILGKATDKQQAQAMLQALCGREHRVYTALAMGFKGQEFVDLAQAMVRMKAYDEALLQAYLHCGEWQGKAGACALQGRGGMLVDSVQGEFYTVVGLSLTALYRGFEALGLQEVVLQALAQVPLKEV